MASDSLRGHNVLGDDDQREAEAGFDAAISLALSAARAAEVRPHLVEAGIDSVKALCRATMEDLMRPRNAEEVYLRGCGLNVGNARALVTEMAVVYATFYAEVQPGQEEAEVQPASVIVGNGAAGGAAGAVVAECVVPDFPSTKDLPSRELFKAYARQLASMLVSWDEQVSVDVLSIVRDPDVGSLRLTQWRTLKDRTLGSKVIGSMGAAIIELIDSDLLEDGYGLPILRDIARTVMMLTDRGLTLKAKQFLDPKPHKQKATLFKALKQWSDDLTVLKKQSQRPSDLIIMTSLELLVSGVKDAQEIVKLMRGQSVISGDDLDHTEVLDILNRESKGWWRESREGKNRAQALLSDPDPDPKSSAKWCFDWVMGGSCR